MGSTPAQKVDAFCAGPGLRWPTTGRRRIMLEATITE